jgi:Protein of unknown function (DUF2865)
LKRWEQHALGTYWETIVKTAGHRSKACRAAGLLLAAWSCTVMAPLRPAAAENFFDMLFGGWPRHARPGALPPQTSSYADPRGQPDRETRSGYGDASPSSGGGHGTVFCVRTCDGRYFPLQRHAGVSPAEQCRSFCPASKTLVFSGSRIDYAVTHNGTRYADLKSAFAYRDRMVENCTCNGRDGLGLAHFNVASDPTLRPGDIVATNDGFVSYRGSKSKNASNTAQFTPLDPTSSAWARRLSEIEIRPAPPAAAVAPVPPADRDASVAIREERRAQLDR